jgi:hypothetical protein
MIIFQEIYDKAMDMHKETGWTYRGVARAMSYIYPLTEEEVDKIEKYLKEHCET